MKVQVEKLPKSELKLTIEVPAEQMQGYEKEALKELQDKVKVPGFRAGHIPMEILKNHVGERSFMSAVLDIALSDAYEKAIQQEKIRPVAYPKLSIKSESPMVFEATIAVLPEVTLKKSLEKFRVKAEALKVEEKEMEDVLDSLLKQGRKWKDVDRKAKKGDRAEIDFDGFDMDNVPLEGTSSKNHPLILGEGSLIPGFEEELEGMSTGQEKEFKIRFPKDYHAKPFQDKEVKFKVKVNRLEEAENPELNDAFVTEFTKGEHKTVDSLKKEIETELLHQKEHAEESRQESDFLNQLTDHAEAEIPEALIEREKAFLKERLMEDLKRRKISMEDYEKMLKEKKKNLEEELATQAEKQVLVRLTLEKLYEDRKIEVSEGEIEEDLKHIFEHYPKEHAVALKEHYKEGSEGREQIRNKLKLKNLVKSFLVSI